jgi:hypothetical protein
LAGVKDKLLAVDPAFLSLFEKGLPKLSKSATADVFSENPYPHRTNIDMEICHRSSKLPSPMSQDIDKVFDNVMQLAYDRDKPMKRICHACKSEVFDISGHYVCVPRLLERYLNGKPPEAATVNSLRSLDNPDPFANRPQIAPAAEVASEQEIAEGQQKRRRESLTGAQTNIINFSKSRGNHGQIINVKLILVVASYNSFSIAR